MYCEGEKLELNNVIARCGKLKLVKKVRSRRTNKQQQTAPTLGLRTCSSPVTNIILMHGQCQTSGSGLTLRYKSANLQNKRWVRNRSHYATLWYFSVVLPLTTIVLRFTHTFTSAAIVLKHYSKGCHSGSLHCRLEPLSGSAVVSKFWVKRRCSYWTSKALLENVALYFI